MPVQLLGKDSSLKDFKSQVTSVTKEVHLQATLVTKCRPRLEFQIRTSTLTTVCLSKRCLSLTDLIRLLHQLTVIILLVKNPVTF